MTQTVTCEQCGATLTKDAMGRLRPCPRCILGMLGKPAVQPSDADSEHDSALEGPGNSPGELLERAQGTPQRDSLPEVIYTQWGDPVRGLKAPEPEDLAPFFPELEILEVIGRGGMGAVYRVRHRNLGREMALKVMDERFASRDDFAQRFEREARALAQLQHPNIVLVYDSGRSGGLCYLTMEYVHGSTLRDLMGEGLESGQALEVVRQLCDALAFAHEAGIVHRDIKPENVLVDARGQVKVADFGLAKMLGEDNSPLMLTGTAQAMGTPHYMAPEQIERPRDVDHRADIYSLGVVFYELLTGELPLGRFELPSEVSASNKDLDQVVLKALAKQPDHRYQRAEHVKTDVDLAEQGGSKVATSSPGFTPGASKTSSGASEPLRVTGAGAAKETWSERKRTRREQRASRSILYRPLQLWQYGLALLIMAVLTQLGIVLQAARFSEGPGSGALPWVPDCIEVAGLVAGISLGLAFWRQRFQRKGSGWGFALGVALIGLPFVLNLVLQSPALFHELEWYELSMPPQREALHAFLLLLLLFNVWYVGTTYVPKGLGLDAKGRLPQLTFLRKAFSVGLLIGCALLAIRITRTWVLPNSEGAPSQGYWVPSSWAVVAITAIIAGTFRQVKEQRASQSDDLKEPSGLHPVISIALLLVGAVFVMRVLLPWYSRSFPVPPDWALVAVTAIIAGTFKQTQTKPQD